MSFTAGSMRPLDYADLAAARLDEPIAVPLEWRDVKVTDTNVPGLDPEASWTAKATLESRMSSRFVALVRGGWLPSALACTDPDAVVFPDRNVVTGIAGRLGNARSGNARPRERGMDFVDLYADRAVRINPLLFALEGNVRSHPSAELAASQAAEASAKLRAALPMATVMDDPGNLRGLAGLLDDTREGVGRRQEFLVRLAPALSAPVAFAGMKGAWDLVLATADSSGVAASALAVVAALSAATARNGGGPARRILKFRPRYGDKEAYNAIADLRSLEILTALFALFPDRPLHLCTGDRNLALFWTGLRASGFRRLERGTSFELAPVEQVIPAHAEPWWREYLEGLRS